EEWKQHAHEEVDRLELLVKVRKQEIREADFRVEDAKSRLNYNENLLTRGMSSKAIIRTNQLNRLESESQLLFRQVALKEAEVQLNRAKRRAARLDRGQANPLIDAAFAETIQPGRLREIEFQLDELRRRHE
ncbi:unnamed protein product, partial [Phaeothamnion confervicola]